tara:strand:+ start:771 stop:1328 length:558 start_codon:yes stop_codon:yes gene_type:complete
MKSIRLNKLIRDDISNAMVASWEKTSPKPCDLRKEQQKVGDAIYKEAHKKITFGNAHLNFFNVSAAIKYTVDGVVQQSIMSCARPMRATAPNRSSDNIAIVYDKTPKVVLDLQKLEKANSDWITLKSIFKEEIQQIISSVNTTQQLVDIWPEAEQYLPAYACDPSKGIKLPALKTSRLNEALGVK